jgi:hypothetical protein
MTRKREAKDDTRWPRPVWTWRNANGARSLVQAFQSDGITGHVGWQRLQPEELSDDGRRSVSPRTMLPAPRRLIRLRLHLLPTLPDELLDTLGPPCLLRLDLAIIDRTLQDSWRHREEEVVLDRRLQHLLTRLLNRPTRLHVHLKLLRRLADEAVEQFSNGRDITGLCLSNQRRDYCFHIPFGDGRADHTPQFRGLLGSRIAGAARVAGSEAASKVSTVCTVW